MFNFTVLKNTCSKQQEARICENSTKATSSCFDTVSLMMDCGQLKIFTCSKNDMIIFILIICSYHLIANKDFLSSSDV